MEKYHVFFLSLHIAAGVVSLILAPVALVVRKGGRAHRKWGKIYFYAMAVVAATAIVMSVYHNIIFLLMIAVFSFAAAARGYRAVFRKKPGQVSGLDWLIETANALFCAGLIVFAYLMWRNNPGSMNIVPAFFGAFGLWISVKQVMRYIRPRADRMAWFYEHLGNMIGSYIASVTAFLLNVVHFLPGVVEWLGPSLIGIPLIFYTIAKYKKRFTAGKTVEQAVAE